MTTFDLIEGECYTYNFPACPGSRPSVFLGNVRVGSTHYLAFQVVETDYEEGEVNFINPKRLSAIRPETW